MSLAAGTRLGSYEIQSALGAGGMGEVYRARDPRLGRDIALKVVSESFTHDPERLARFRREAQLLAALNHPNIATIHGLEESDSTQFLVMELVEGDTLADRLIAGPIPVAEALTIAHQVAEALQAAHDKGIIHRDLKPANIKVREDGTVKVLDFGLAKMLGPDEAGHYDPGGAGAGDRSIRLQPDLTASPTLSFAATQAGMILGTAAYMAPEQARGKPADKRADIWAFGCVLYEMLTGRRVFEGEDAAITLAAALMREPDWSLLPTDLPPAIRSVLRRCLEKDRGKRLAEIAAALVLIEESSALTASTAADPALDRERQVLQAQLAAAMTGSRRRVVTSTVAAIVLGGLLVGAAVWWITRPAPPRVVRTEIVTTGETVLSISGPDRDLAITPDGSRIVYRGNNQLLVRALDRLEPVVLKGLGNPRNVFVSPDGQWIGFFDGPAPLKKVAITGGPAVTVTNNDGPPRGATWGPDDTIVYATAREDTGLFRVPAAGGDSTLLTKPNRDAGEGDHLWPEFLPGGRALLFTIFPASGGLDGAQVAVLDLATGAYKVVIRGGHHAHYVPSGHLVYGASGTLRAVAFDLDRLEATGTPAPVLEGVLTSGTGATDAVAAGNGTLVYVPGALGGGLTTSLVWVTREGREEAVPAPPRAYVALRLSPDGARAALDVRGQENDIWVWDFARRTLARLTFAPELETYPVWTPDGRRIVFTRLGGVFARAADGTGAEESLAASVGGVAMSFSPDGKQLVVTTAGSGSDIGVLAMDGKGEVKRVVQTTFAEGHSDLSPDGRWLAYQSDESGQNQVYVQPFPNVSSGRWQVSPAGGTDPAWARNGRELFYRDAAGALVAVPVQTQSTFTAGNPAKLFDANYAAAGTGRSYDVSPDGKRFLFIKNSPAPTSTGAQASPSLVVVQGWFEELKRLVPAN